MGILSVHRNMLSSCKSQLKHPSSSSNWWFIRRISNSNTGSSKTQSHAPTGDLKSNNKLMLLIEHFSTKNLTESERKVPRRFPPCCYSTISAENSWKDHHNLSCLFSNFSGFGEYSLAGSCNEFLLFLVHSVDSLFDGRGKYLLWNPTANVTKLLPPPGPVYNRTHCFGFDSESEDYKLIRFPLVWYTDVVVELYSLKTNSWKKIKNHWSNIVKNHLSRPSVHINGVYYWEAFLHGFAIILSFDFANEKFSSLPFIPRPPKFDVHSRGTIRGLFVDDFVLVEFDGSLAALVHSGNMVKPFGFEVWGWNGKSWLEKLPRTTIDVPGGVFKVLGLFQDDKLFLQGSQKGEVLLFDLEKSKLENLGIHADLMGVDIFPFHAGSSIPLMENK